MTIQSTVGDVIAITITDIELALSACTLTLHTDMSTRICDGSRPATRWFTDFHKRSEDMVLRTLRQQRNGGQPGGSGVQRTIESRHPRRRVPVPDQSMNRMGFKGRWSEDQNLTDWYTVGIKNSCDFHSQSVDSGTAAHPQAPYREVAR